MYILHQAALCHACFLNIILHISRLRAVLQPACGRCVVRQPVYGGHSSAQLSCPLRALAMNPCRGWPGKTGRRKKCFQLRRWQLRRSRCSSLVSPFLLSSRHGQLSSTSNAALGTKLWVEAKVCDEAITRPQRAPADLVTVHCP